MIGILIMSSLFEANSIASSQFHIQSPSKFKLFQNERVITLFWACKKQFSTIHQHISFGLHSLLNVHFLIIFLWNWNIRAGHQIWYAHKKFCQQISWNLKQYWSLLGLQHRYSSNSKVLLSIKAYCLWDSWISAYLLGSVFSFLRLGITTFRINPGYLEIQKFIFSPQVRVCLVLRSCKIDIRTKTFLGQNSCNKVLFIWWRKQFASFGRRTFQKYLRDAVLYCLIAGEWIFKQPGLNTGQQSTRICWDKHSADTT